MCNFPVPALLPLDGGRPVLGVVPYLHSLAQKNPNKYRDITLPCGKCLACRLQRSKEWAVRCILESKLHEFNCFVTLTYNNDNLPANGSLVPRDLQLFIKRLRKKFGAGIRFFACGEYGSKYQRPHYHILLFGFDFRDKVPWKTSSATKFGNSIDNVIYRSPDLEQLWPYGFSTVGAVSYESAAYVSRYILKKQRVKPMKFGGVVQESFYDKNNLVPEFTRMSRKPGIAKEWFDKNIYDIYTHDYIQISDKIKAHPPRYFDNLFDAIYPDTMESIKLNRELKLEEMQEKRPDQFTPSRLRAKEKVLDVNAKNKLVRSYEKGDT